MNLISTYLYKGKRKLDEETSLDMFTSYHPKYKKYSELPGRSLNPTLPDCYLTQGLVDLQINGICGIDFSRCRKQQSFLEAARCLTLHGVTRFLATKITSPISTYTPEAFASFYSKWNSLNLAHCMGWHLEGPFINPKYGGAHTTKWMSHSFDKTLWKEILSTKRIRLVTQAPEVPQGMALLELCAEMGVPSAIGHTNPSIHDLQKVSQLGCHMVTHLFNGMKQFHHRNSGVIGAVLGNTDWNFSLISDCIHLDEGTIRLAARARPDGIILVSDLCPLAYSDSHSCRFGGKTIYNKDVGAYTKKGTLAGSICSLDEILHRFCSSTSVPLQTALEYVTTKPLQVIQENDSSCNMDAVLWHKQSIVQVWINGSAIF